MKKLILKDFVKKEIDWLWSLINDEEWREEMWIAKGSVNKNM